MIVVDTNILAYCLMPGPKNQQAEALLEANGDWAAPYLWRSEMRNLLTGYIRKGEYDGRTAEILMQKAGRFLTGGEHFVDDHAIFELVGESKCTAYDCEFVALAQTLGTYLVTEDKALLQAFPSWCRSLEQAIASSQA